MKTYLVEPVKIKELSQWEANKKINPRSGRKIKSTSKIYKYLEKELIKYKLRQKKEYTWIDCYDEKEPITLDIIWKLKNNKKIKGEIEDNDMIYYKDSFDLIRGFKIISLIRMFDNNYKNHPVTNDIIPEHVFKSAQEKYKVLVKENKIQDITKNVIVALDKKALNVFQKLSLDTFFIDHLEFLNSLNINGKMYKFNNEFKDIFNENLDEITKKTIYPPSGKPFNKKYDELCKMDNDTFKHYILDELNILLQNGSDNQMLKYIIVGTLGLVIPKIREIYGDGFSFSFNI